MRVVNASRDWNWEQLQPYADGVMAHLAKLEARFPDDLTTQSLVRECVTGAKQLWLVLDGDDLTATAMTQVRTLDATGKKVAMLIDLAGDDVAAWADCLCDALEAWAEAEGADLMAVEGRPGWKRVLERKGYRTYAVLYRKQVGARHVV